MAWFEDGTSRIYYEEEGRGVPVLLLPGWAGSIKDLSALREALAMGYRVIAAELARGVTLQDCAKACGLGYSHTHLIRRRFVQELQERMGMGARIL